MKKVKAFFTRKKGARKGPQDDNQLGLSSEPDSADELELGPREPGAEEPDALKPGAEEPGTLKPGTEEPGGLMPGAEEPGVLMPGAQEPGMLMPGAEEPGVLMPGAEKPNMLMPGAEEPSMLMPGAEEPGVLKPGAQEPGMLMPGAEEPGVLMPGAEEPSMLMPGAEEPGMLMPGAEEPGMLKPGAEEPGALKPGAEEPGMLMPGVEEPGMLMPGAKEPGELKPEEQHLKESANMEMEAEDLGLQLRNVEEPRMTAETAPSSTMAPPSGETPANYCYHPEYARMEAWMDEHPDFAADYFVRKATRNMVDAWLVAHATSMSTGSSMESSSLNLFPGQGGQGSGSSRGNSGATTPVRKISAHEFERGGLLKPMVSNVDGTPTFLSLAAPEGQPLVGSPNAVFSPVLGSRSPRRSRNELRNLDEKELIFELVKDICNDLDVRSLCHKILQNVSMLLQADRCSLFLVRGERLPPCPDCFRDGENARCNRCASSECRHLVSKLFDVCSRSTLQEMERKEEIIIPWGTGIVGFVAERGEPVNIPDAYKDDRFNHDIDARTGYTTRTLLCMPIKDINGDVLGVAQVINKTNDSCFTAADENVFAKYLQFCGIGLKNAQLYEKSQLEIKRNQVLLDLARVIFEEQTTMENMVYKILVHTQSLIQCHRVQVLLIHEGSAGIFSRVFDFEAGDLEIEDEDGEPRKKPYEGRFPINIGITGQVAANGNTINIPNVSIDQRFDPSVDAGSDFSHKSVLCMPIRDSTSKIIGVIQLVNKFGDLAFTKNDENFVEAFAIFCGLAIHNTNIYERAVMAMAKQNVTLEVLSYHASASLEDAKRLKTLRVPSSHHFGLHDFTFDDIYFSDDETLTACIRMFVDLDFIERFHIDYEVLCRWLLSVKKNYRNVTYHNWRHAFNVAQMMFAILTATQWWKILGEIECLSLLIACLCHDLDHRGTNNSFQVKASSPLAQLYTTSTMEHHHFDQCIMILNSQGNQILANVTSDEYTQVVKLLEEAILATDLAVYFRKRGAFVSLVRSKNYDWYVDEHRELLRGMMMTICDLAAITKPWEIEKRVAELVTSEFFEQGDIEREELKIIPIDIMNREKEDQLPMMQIGFIDTICYPIYETFSLISDSLIPLLNGVLDNRRHWLERAKINNLEIPARDVQNMMNSGFV